MIDFTELCGLAAATLTTVSFVPQLWLTLRSRDLSAISPLMYGVFSLGVLLWLLYGLVRADLPIVLANAVTLAQSLLVLVLRLRWGLRQRACSL